MLCKEIYSIDKNRVKHQHTTMDINNCYYGLILKIPADFSACRVFAKVVATHGTVHSRDRCKTLPKTNE